MAEMWTSFPGHCPHQTIFPRNGPTWIVYPKNGLMVDLRPGVLYIIAYASWSRISLEFCGSLVSTDYSTDTAPGRSPNSCSIPSYICDPRAGANSDQFFKNDPMRTVRRGFGAINNSHSEFR